MRNGVEGIFVRRMEEGRVQAERGNKHQKVIDKIWNAERRGWQIAEKGGGRREALERTCEVDAGTCSAVAVWFEDLHEVRDKPWKTTRICGSWWTPLAAAVH